MHPFVAEPLADGVNGLPQGDTIAPGAVGMRVGSGEEAGTRRSAYGLAGIGAVEANPAIRQTVQVRRLQSGLAIAVQHIGAGGIGHQEDGAASRGRCGGISLGKGGSHGLHACSTHEIAAIHSRNSRLDYSCMTWFRKFFLAENAPGAIPAISPAVPSRQSDPS